MGRKEKSCSSSSGLSSLKQPILSSAAAVAASLLASVSPWLLRDQRHHTTQKYQHSHSLPAGTPSCSIFSQTNLGDVFAFLTDSANFIPVYRRNRHSAWPWGQSPSGTRAWEKTGGKYRPIEIPAIQQRPAFGRLLFAFGTQERPLDRKHTRENPTPRTWF